MVRGLDYYVRTAFELVTDRLGAASAVGGGGRYDGLVKLMGGGNVPGIGFAVGMDRIVALMKEKQRIAERKADVFVLFFEGKSEEPALSLIKELRSSGLIVEYDYSISSMKSQMKKANRAGAKYAVIFGESEIESGNVSVKNLEDGGQSLEPIEGIADTVRKLLV
ncbi:MAG: ATP phosphoribosyltransferase regulatory subunit, partial [Deferribacterales bacterium]|nr:ATP phosphoribosyltransferase regulatory subunit [Deferribacterales bacterium]